jgi:glycosyltransferase involved in cell wall biosynthesis
MPVYNGIENYPEGTLRNAITSTAGYKGVKVELCLVNDASTDGSQLWIDHYADKDSLVKTSRMLENMGVATSLRRASDMATGRYILVQSVRSWYSPWGVKAMVDALDDNPDIGFVYGQTQYHGARQDRHTPPSFNANDFKRDFVSLFGYMYRREAFEMGAAYEGYIEREGKHIDICDYDFIMQLIYRLGWDGLALRDTLTLNYLYSGAGQMTNLVHKYQVDIDAIFEERWLS